MLILTMIAVIALGAFVLWAERHEFGVQHTTELCIICTIVACIAYAIMTSL